MTHGVVFDVHAPSGTVLIDTADELDADLIVLGTRCLHTAVR